MNPYFQAMSQKGMITYSRNRYYGFEQERVNEWTVKAVMPVIWQVISS